MKLLFVITFIALLCTLITYWLARTDNLNGKVYFPNSIFKAFPNDNNEVYADSVITVALVLCMCILVRNIMKR